MTTVQQIVYTNALERWWTLAEAMGFSAPFTPDPAWAEFHGGGVLAVHRATDEHRAGMIDIHLLVDDLDTAQARIASFHPERITMDGVGEMLQVRVGSGLSITVSAGAVPPASGSIAVQPIWFQPDLGEPRALLEALGLAPGVAADRGGWVELTADGGSVGLHQGEPRLGLSFEARGDLDALAARLRDAGFDASVVDEAFARTIRIPDPDRGAEVWINGVQDDLHGYHRES
ncbi:hypothetical protein GCM10025768_19120 [Microbacterium pseudoresistens]|uniref:VOC family protein n=1 Tax=Microbacterium pseudoresistens TaxID=640634 RepID=A0A7Y9EXE8_9MICO|nr:hypothetical protein [Microbacterium pseudoresistens]NYD55606.1 hypothetical protein [Microbacterium pseudoresistens]